MPIEELVLLVGTASIKTLVLALMSLFLFRKWRKQEKRFISDFPFLMSLTFLIFAFTKIFDIWLYVHFSENPYILQQNTAEAIFLGKIRFMMVILCVAPYFYLMQKIWFEGKPKLQITLSAGWLMVSTIAVLNAARYSDFLLTISIAAFPPILLSIITFAIIYHLKKLPEINSLALSMGWSAYLITQLIRPLWIKLGEGVFGLTWIGELLELSALMIVGFGFMKPSHYRESREDRIASRIHTRSRTTYSSYYNEEEDLLTLEEEEEIIQ